MLKFFGEKLPVGLLCMVINSSPDEIVLPKHRHVGEMKLLSNTDYPLEPLMINDVTKTIDSDQVN